MARSICETLLTLGTTFPTFYLTRSTAPISSGQPEILALVDVMERPITVRYEDSDKGTLFGECFTDRPGIDILYYPEERDDKGELIKAGHYVLLLSQPENGKVYSPGDYVPVRSETNDWFMCVISEVNDPSKEIKVRFMRKLIRNSKTGYDYLFKNNRLLFSLLCFL